MLRPPDDPSKIAYSFTLFERRDGANLVRVQTDSVNQPFDINSGRAAESRLDRETAYRGHVSADRLRPACALCVDEHGGTESREARSERSLTHWALDYLAHTPDRSLQAMLDAAVERKYSASPGETFYTGGGAQTFNNFESDDNSRILTVHRAFQHSVNLVFVRLMRDIVHYEMVQTTGPSVAMARRSGDPQDVSDALCRSGKPRVHESLLHEVSRQDARPGAGLVAARRAQIAA